jgi:uncharacterized protein (DUF58 family)
VRARAGLTGMFRRGLYRSYRRFYGMAYRLNRRFTPAGRFALAGLITAAAVGLDTNQTTAYQAFTFLAALFCGSFLWVAIRSFQRRGNRFTVRRHLPRFGTVGSAVSYAIVVRNETSRPCRSLTLLENLEDPRPSWAEFSRRSVRRVASRLDELFGYSRWWNLVASRQPAGIREAALPALPPHGEVEVRIELVPKRRGRVHFTGMTLARPDVFGLVRNHWFLPASQSLVILPKRYLLPPVALPGTSEYQPAGVALASSVGQSDEFVALREYRPGDPWRHIHWSSVAKTDRLIVREHEDEFFVRHALILDTFAGPEQEATFEEAVSVAASFVCTIQTQESLLDLLFVGTEAFCFTAGRGVGHVDRMLEILAGVQMCEDQPFPALEALVLRHATLMSGCVCVFLAWDKPRQHLVRLLRALRVPLRVCVVTGDAQLDPGPMRDQPGNFHALPVDRIQEALARL